MSHGDSPCASHRDSGQTQTLVTRRQATNLARTNRKPPDGLYVRSKDTLVRLFSLFGISSLQSGNGRTPSLRILWRFPASPSCNAAGSPLSPLQLLESFVPLQVLEHAVKNTNKFTVNSPRTLDPLLRLPQSIKQSISTVTVPFSCVTCHGAGPSPSCSIVGAGYCIQRWSTCGCSHTPGQGPPAQSTLAPTG